MTKIHRHLERIITLANGHRSIHAASFEEVAAGTDRWVMTKSHHLDTPSWIETTASYTGEPRGRQATLWMQQMLMSKGYRPLPGA